MDIAWAANLVKWHLRSNWGLRPVKPYSNRYERSRSCKGSKDSVWQIKVHLSLTICSYACTYTCIMYLLTSLMFPVMFEKLLCPDPSDVSSTSWDRTSPVYTFTNTWKLSRSTWLGDCVHLLYIANPKPRGKLSYCTLRQKHFINPANDRTVILLTKSFVHNHCSPQNEAHHKILHVLVYIISTTNLWPWHKSIPCWVEADTEGRLRCS